MNKKSIILMLFAVLFANSALLAQLKFENNGYSAALSGFIRSDMFVDSEPHKEGRDGAFSILPVPKQYKSTPDFKEGTQYNILAIQTRLGLRLDAPEINGMKIGGFIEAEFYGTTDANINTPRLRHAYIDVTSGKSNFKMGQYWHVLNDYEVAATCLNPTIGLCYVAGVRAPQFRYTYNATDECSIYGVISAQRDFASTSKNGKPSTLPARKAIPEIGAGVKYSTKDFGVSLNASVKTIKPELPTSKPLDSDFLSTFATTAHIRYSAGDFTVKAMGGYGQNLEDGLNISSYGLYEETTSKYVPMNQMLSFLDLSYGKKLKVGLFLGYNKNLGGADKITQYISRHSFTVPSLLNPDGDIYNLESTMRIVPRLSHRIGNFSYGVEFDVNSATWGKLENEEKCIIKDAERNTIYRASLAFTYHL